MEKNPEFYISILVYRDEDGWAALALEMDVRGFGANHAEALTDLAEMLKAQVSYAVQMQHPDSVWKPAAQEFWDQFEEARRQQFVSEITGRKSTLDSIAQMIPLPDFTMKTWAAAGA